MNTPAEWNEYRQLWLVAVLQEHGKWVRSLGREGTRANLRNANLRNANLRNVNLENAYLRGANLRNANLRNANLRNVNLRNVNLENAYLGGANLRGANLENVNLENANLENANLENAYLRGANLKNAYLENAGVPTVPQLHTQMMAAIKSQPESFDMGFWHGSNEACGTTHCRAGYVVHLAGEAGLALENRIGTAAAGALITFASCPWLTNAPNWHDTNEAALADIRECAAREQQESP